MTRLLNCFFKCFWASHRESKTQIKQLGQQYTHEANPVHETDREHLDSLKAKKRIGYRQPARLCSTGLVSPTSRRWTLPLSSSLGSGEKMAKGWPFTAYVQAVALKAQPCLRSGVLLLVSTEAFLGVSGHRVRTSSASSSVVSLK